MIGADYWPSSVESIRSDVGICKLCKIAKDIKLGKRISRFPTFDLDKWWYGDEEKGRTCKPTQGKEYDLWKKQISFF